MSTILVVDDAATDRRLTGGLLEKCPNWQVEYASNGNEALNLIKEKEIDLVVTDLQMPEMDGLNLVQAIRVQYANIPVILITGHGSEDLAVSALERGAASFVPKDQLAQMLVSTVDELLHLTREDRGYQTLINCMTTSEFSFTLPNDYELVAPLVDLVQQMTQGVGLCDSIDCVRIGVALEQALLNAIFRGNLEISRESMQRARERLMEGIDDDIVGQRMLQQPYSDRRVSISVKVEKAKAEFVVADEGSGFDTAIASVAADPDAIQGESGRGLVLMNTFMDEVRFNEAGNQVTMLKYKSGETV